MAQAFDKFGIVYQNLKDAGCDDAMADRCMALAQRHDYAALLRVMTGYRKTLLSRVQRGQKQIDCLDYLIYKLKKENN